MIYGPLFAHKRRCLRFARSVFTVLIVLCHAIQVVAGAGVNLVKLESSILIRRSNAENGACA
jgi:hypothetical protein